MNTPQQRGGQAEALSIFDAAIERELPRVSHVHYDSHEICKHFAGEVRKQIEALTSAPPSPSVGGWMPIETAPKDGSVILLCSEDDTHVMVREGKWDRDAQRWVWPHFSGRSPMWWCPMPLPQPPKEKP